jgi:hypothetical protein
VCGPQFRETCEEAVERLRGATRGSADVLLLTTVPSVRWWTTMAELAEAVRVAAQGKKAFLADPEKAFLAAGQKGHARLFTADETHLGPAGHELMAATVLEAIDQAGQ